MGKGQAFQPRDVLKLAFQFQPTEVIPYCFSVSDEQAAALTAHYGGDGWAGKVVRFFGWVSSVDNFLCREPLVELPDGTRRDCLGCRWRMGTTHHLVDWPLREPRMGGYRLPDLEEYYRKHLRPLWPDELRATRGRFRLIGHSFGLFERAWSLRGFEGFLTDLAAEERFAEELLERITEWLLQSVDLMAGAPADAVMFTDDHAAQRGMLMGAERWRRLFLPRWRRIFDRVHHYGLYTVLHACGDTSEVVGDLIDAGLDCLESCQPECMDVYALKKRYGADLRFWGGLGAQGVLPFGTPQQVRQETRRLLREMGAGGGYVLAPAKPPGAEVPVANIAAYLEEATGQGR